MLPRGEPTLNPGNWWQLVARAAPPLYDAFAMLGNRSNEQWIAQYASSHQHPLNRACHTLGIPTILMGFGLLFVCSGAFFGDRLPSHWMEVLITFAGSSCQILAHRINHTFCRNCTECCVGDAEDPHSPYPLSR